MRHKRLSLNRGQRACAESLESRCMLSASPAKAFVSITPGPTNLGIDASTWTPKSFTITNNSPDGQKIQSISIDISSSLLPDLIFTPTTAGGDDVPKDLTADSDPTVVGLTTHAYDKPLDGGYQQLEIDFDNFGAGKTFLFSLDIDPADIKGAHSPGPSGSGGISGLELTGSHWTFNFDDGASVTSDIYRTPSSVSGGQNIVEAGGPPQPLVQLLNVATTPTTLNNATQKVRVTGPAGAHVQLMADDAGLYLSGVPGGGFDLHPFESNRVVKITEFSATVGAGGFVDIPIKLMKTDSNAGFNHIVAVFKDANGRTGPVSQDLVVRYVPPTLSVTALELVNADTGKVISGYANITNGQTINLASLPTRHLTLVAISSGGVKSVKFGLDSNTNYHVSNLTPFSIAGIWNGKYNYWKPPLGKHTITVTPYGGTSATGTVGLPLKLTINFVNNPAT